MKISKSTIISSSLLLAYRFLAVSSKCSLSATYSTPTPPSYATTASASPSSSTSYPSSSTSPVSSSNDSEYQYRIYEGKYQTGFQRAEYCCNSLNGSLADINSDNIGAISSQLNGPAWISSWNGDHYGGYCLALYPGGAIAPPTSGSCHEQLGYVCKISEALIASSAGQNTQNTTNNTCACSSSASAQPASNATTAAQNTSTATATYLSTSTCSSSTYTSYTTNTQPISPQGSTVPYSYSTSSSTPVAPQATPAANNGSSYQCTVQIQGTAELSVSCPSLNESPSLTVSPQAQSTYTCPQISSASSQAAATPEAVTTITLHACPSNLLSHAANQAQINSYYSTSVISQSASLAGTQSLTVTVTPTKDLCTECPSCAAAAAQRSRYYSQNSNQYY